MTFHQNEVANFILGPIVKGTIVGFLAIIFLTISLGMITNAGWQGMLHWSSGGYLILVYLALIIGSLFAGFYSYNSGWVVGMGVGLLLSFLCLINALLSGEGIKWLFYIFKTFIHCFIGAFGGIIGINIIKK